MNHVLNKSTKIVIVLMCLLLGFAQWSFAQGNSIKGKVTDEAGAAVIGANVAQKGTGAGTVTDENGNFTLTAPGNATLVISYLGYATKEIKVNNQSNLTIQLSEDTQGLNEVVVVGYGTQKKATLTGSVSAVTNKEIAITKNENVVNMLAGKIPGVRVTQTSSRPGAFETTYDIRGLGTPLIVIDGVPSDGDTFARLDANDIESISVLKDASAAVYGLRSANGVILVTTKRGSAGGFNIEYSTNYGWQSFLHVPNNVNAIQYMQLANEKNLHDFNGNYFANRPPIFTDADMQPYLNGTLQTTDWMNAIFNKTAPQYQHNITLDGGNDRVKYFFNLGYMKQESSLKSGSMSYDRWNFRSNVDANITNHLKASISLGGYMDNMLEPNQDIWTIYKNAWMQLPNVTLYANNNPEYLNNGDGTQYHSVHDGNPLGNTNSDYVGFNQYINRQFTGQAALQYTVPGIDGLTAKAMYNYNFRDKDSQWYKKAYNVYSYNATNDTYAPSIRNASAQGTNSIQREDDKWYNTLLQLSLNYKHTFAKIHNVEAVVLYEEEYNNADNFYAYRNLTLNSQYLFAGDAANQVGSMNQGGLWDTSSRAFVGKFDYDFMGKYMIDFSFRYDGTSKFAPGKRFGFFPAVSGGYRISEESFFKNSALSFIDNLKFRVSYGKTGDDSAASTYPPDVVGYAIQGSNVGWIFNNNVYTGVKATGIPNPNLTWYTAKMFNIGLDFDLWKGLFSGSIEYFNRNRDGLLATSTAVIPGTVGATMPQANLDSDRSFGYELTLSHRNKIGNVGYNISGQMYATRTQWRTHTETPKSNEYDQWRNSLQNRYTGIWWGNNYMGQFQNYQQIYSYPVAIGAGTALPGDYYYRDWNGDGVIDGNDDHPIATYGLPLFNYGITLGANYKGFDLSVNFQGAAQIFYRYTEVLAEPLSFGDAGTMTKFLDRWHPADPNANPYDPSTQWISGYYQYTTQAEPSGTRAIENASYLRLKTLDLGYTIPNRVLSKFGVKNLRIYFSGYNILTFTGLRDMDPEHPGGEGGAETNSVDTYKYPINKTLNIGASIKF